MFYHGKGAHSFICSFSDGSVMFVQQMIDGRLPLNAEPHAWLERKYHRGRCCTGSFRA